MKKILLCQHVGSLNHGCEALVRAVTQIIMGLSEPCQITLYSYRKQSDQEFLSDVQSLKITGLKELPDKDTVYNFIYKVKKRFSDPNKTVSRVPITTELKNLIADADLVIAIGGDNYCRNKGEGYYALDKYIGEQGKKYLLLGCSVEPVDLKEGLAQHLKVFTQITARESITYKAMLENDMTNVSLIHDPSFLLPAVNKELPPNFIEGNTVGINISPLLMKKERREGIVLKNYEMLVRYILENTDMAVALTANVTAWDEDDGGPLSQLNKIFEGESRVFALEACGARELKGYISRMRFMVGARMHATIAAYSAYIPTLAVGYSVKSFGVVNDIFDSDKDYVVSVQTFLGEQHLTEAFKKLMADEEQIIAVLKKKMPDYILNAELAGECIAKLLKR